MSSGLALIVLVTAIHVVEGFVRSDIPERNASVLVPRFIRLSFVAEPIVTAVLVEPG
jgi:hypothetical protein